MADRLEAMAGWVVGDASPAVGRRGSGWLRGAGAGAPSGTRHGLRRRALSEVEVRDGLGFGRIVQGRLVDVEAGVDVEAEVVLGRTACG